MTGSGTQTDPYIVDNWNDLISVINHIGVYIEFDNNSENKIIDMSKIYPMGIGNISCGFKSLNGNDWTIKNIYCPYDNLFLNNKNVKSDISFENLNIINVYKKNSKLSNMDALFISTSLYYRFYLKKCKISCVIEDESSYDFPATFSKHTNIYNSSINIKSYSKFLIPFGQYNLKNNLANNCDINIHTQTDSKTITIFDHMSIDNSKISGVIENIGNFSLNSSNPMLSVIDLKTNYSKKINSSKKGLINSDKAPNIIAGTNTSLVTTEQMIDFDYLTSIGFPISTTTGWMIKNGELKTDQMPDMELIGAFANDTSLTKVVIPKSVKFIGENAFRNTALSSVKISSDCVYGSESFPESCNIQFY